MLSITRPKTAMIQHSPILVILLILSCCCIGDVRSQQQLGVATIGNNNNAAADVVRNEYYEYNAPGAQRYRRQRQAGPFGGVIPGLVITILSSTLQWYNEGRAVRDAKMLAYAKRKVVELDSISPIDPENDGKLVHVTGHVTTDGGLVDPKFGLFRPNALQLTSTTEAYQWKEKRNERKTRVSETETKVVVEYRYIKEWTKRPIESNRFQSPGHNNPYPKYGLGRDTMTVNDARISNGLRLRPDLVNQIGTTSFRVNGISDRPHHHCTSPVILGSGEDLPHTDDAVISSNKLYFPENKRPSELIDLDHGSQQLDRILSTRIAIVRSMPSPEVGDIRVSWLEVTAPSDGVSILAQQQDGKLVPWSHGDEGHNVYSLFPGRFTAQTMILELIGKSKFVTRLLRFGGWVGSFIGLNLVLSCIPALLKLVPFGIGNILEPLAYIATSTIALGASFGLSLAVISVAWLRFRPLLAAGLAFLSGAGFLGPLYYARWKRSPEVEEMDAKLRAPMNMKE
mmetsp:Transcript_19246/g.35393  ORF Transcript_19246/g.35393 Transcript_19246/m.35393 type:complete len:511 (+) Transcript_19246:109-1641(+)